MRGKTSARVAPSPPPPYPGAAAQPAGAYSWNAPRSAINPLTGAGCSAPHRTALADLIALYAVDNRHEIARREQLSDEVWQRFFYSESRDPELRQWQQDAAISRARMAHEQHRFNADLIIIDDVRAQPAFISKPLLSRIDYLQKNRSPRLLSRYLRDVVVPSLTRLDRVRESQQSASFRFIASRDGLDGLLSLPAYSQQDVKQLATRVAARMDIVMMDTSDDLMTKKNVTPDEIRQVWERVAAETLRLDVIPPAYEQLRRKRRRRQPVPYDLIPGSLARMRCADWWYRKLWQLRCEWREEQLRAVCLVSKKSSPYVSNEALIHKREQRRRSLEFFRAHELVNDDGDVLDMETVVNASASNPAHRRNEMMACVKGLELIAEMRRDCAVFYTITCPSKFHATLSNGKPNPTWSAATVRQSSDYLVDVFASIRKSLGRNNLRWYGVRVSEPHHDGTVHWHLLCFMRKKDRRKITAIMRKFAIREDRAELGNNTGPRFKSELINPRKGSPTSYIAKYVSKNIDGRGLADTVSRETGKSLRDTAEHVTAWASLHRVQQFRFFGIPSRQAYRELRLFAGQTARSQSDGKPGAPVLSDPRLDAVLAAADVGCFATYITKQGGVLVPRDQHLIRTAYDLRPEPGAYGDHGIRVYGIWSPLLHDRICTHATTWKVVKKSPVVQEALADQRDDVAPWTRGNNCPHGEKTGKNGEWVVTGTSESDPAAPAIANFDNMTHTERREMLKRLRIRLPKINKATKPAAATLPADGELMQNLDALLQKIGINAEPWELNALASGARVSFGPGQAFRCERGRLIFG